MNRKGRKPGLSFIVCCHNSENKIEKVLKHIACQDRCDGVPWEVIVIDNASTDLTAQKAAASCKTRNDISMRIVNEPLLGLGYARLRGIKEAQFDWISFIDDDNWISANWVKTVSHVMTNHPEVAACGSLNVLAKGAGRPWWFERFQKSFAIGPQDEIAGDITNRRGVLCGAGLTIRKSAVEKLFRRGYRPVLIGRQGTKLTAAEDYEMCLALRLDGWRIWYEPQLRLQHAIDKNRMSWTHLRRMIRGMGYSSPFLDPYYDLLDCLKKNRIPTALGQSCWLKAVGKTAVSILQNFGRVIKRQSFFKAGDMDHVLLERSVWRLYALLKLRRQYDLNYQAILAFKWSFAKLSG